MSTDSRSNSFLTPNLTQWNTDYIERLSQQLKQLKISYKMFQRWPGKQVEDVVRPEHDLPQIDLQILVTSIHQERLFDVPALFPENKINCVQITQNGGIVRELDK